MNICVSTKYTVLSVEYQESFKLKKNYVTKFFVKLNAYIYHRKKNYSVVNYISRRDYKDTKMCNEL